MEGQPPYHPRDLTALYLYGMLNRLRSSRQLEEAGYDRFAVRWLMSGQAPDHSTIAEFVSVHRVRLRELFRDVLGLGVRRFLRRGLEAVRTEWSLLCTAVNVGILLRHWPEVMKVL